VAKSTCFGVKNLYNFELNSSINEIKKMLNGFAKAIQSNS